MNFGQALEELKAGKKVARSGWNGKGMFLYLVRGSFVNMNNLRDDARKALTPLGSTPPSDVFVAIGAHIDMKAADGSIVVGWLASQTDMLAEDWVIVE